jgi:hypothetical protein
MSLFCVTEMWTVDSNTFIVSSFQVSYLFCALGDGHLFSFVLNSKCELSARRTISLGTQPISLCKFSYHDRTHVFAASDRSTIIYSSDKKLLYSYVNLKEMSHVCLFNTAVFPERYIPPSLVFSYCVSSFAKKKFLGFALSYFLL